MSLALAMIMRHAKVDDEKAIIHSEASYIPTWCHLLLKVEGPRTIPGMPIYIVTISIYI